MTIPLTYAFNQKRLENLTKLPGAEKIVFSVCNLRNPVSGKIYLYLCAHAFDGNNKAVVVNTLKNKAEASFGEVEGESNGTTGCPTPPGWGVDVPPPAADEIGLAPQFSVSIATLQEVLDKNVLTIKDVKELHVELLGALDADGLEAKLAIYSKNTDKSLSSAIFAESFPSQEGGASSTGTISKQGGPSGADGTAGAAKRVA